VSENTELLMEAPQDVAQEPASRTAELTEQQFDQLVEKLIILQQQMAFSRRMHLRHWPRR